MNADAALMLSSVRAIRMLCKVESTVLLAMDDRVVNRKFGMMELAAVMVGTIKTQLLGSSWDVFGQLFTIHL